MRSKLVSLSWGSVKILLSLSLTLGLSLMGDWGDSLIKTLSPDNNFQKMTRKTIVHCS